MYGLWSGYPPFSYWSFITTSLSIQENEWRCKRKGLGNRGKGGLLP